MAASRCASLGGARPITTPDPTRIVADSIHINTAHNAAPIPPSSRTRAPNGVAWTQEADAKAKMLEADRRYYEYATMTLKAHLSFSHDPERKGCAWGTSPVSLGMKARGR